MRPNAKALCHLKTFILSSLTFNLLSIAKVLIWGVNEVPFVE